MIGAGWAEIQTHLNHQVRAFLHYLAHPAHGPSLEKQIITDLETDALRQMPHDERPRVLRLDFFDKHPTSVKIFEELGYQFSHAEDEMCYHLGHIIPPIPLPEGFRLENWSAERGKDFYKVYYAAFSPRPNFPNWSQETWMQAFTGGDDFRAEWSWLLLEGENPVGYTVCHLDGERPFITQIGVHPAYQRRGLANVLLVQNLRQFQASNLAEAWLEVNINNPQAFRVYRRLGFEVIRRYSSYQKIID